MDTITHGLSGLLLGSSLKNKTKLPRKLFLFISGFAAIFPDLDIIFRLFSEMLYYENHRGITHSIFLLPIWAYIIAISWKKLLLQKSISKYFNFNEELNSHQFKHIFLLTTLGISIHIAGDLITSYGTMLFSPFSNQKFSFGSVFIIDLIFTGIIISSLIIGKFLKTEFQKSLISKLGLIVLILYVSFTQLMKHNVEKHFYADLNQLSISPYRSEIYPQPLSPFLWRGLAYSNEESKYYIKYYDLLNLEDSSNESFETIQKWGNNPEEVITIWENPKNNFLKWFFDYPSFNYVSQYENESCYYFEDLRFGNKMRSNPFVYGLCVSHDENKLFSTKKSL